MARPLRTVLALSSLSLLFACGGPQPGPKTPGAQPGTEPSDGQIAGGGGSPDLSPVQAPPELIAFGRLSSPGQVVDVMAAWGKLPIDWRKALQQNEPELARVLATEAPLEFAAALDPAGSGDFPQPFAVVSLGVNSVEGAVDFAKRQGSAVRMSSPGVYRIAKDGGPACAVAASVGKAPARLVCGDRPADLDALLPYVTRGLPAENMGTADFHAEVRAEPLRKRYSRELRQLKTLAMPFVLRELSMDNPRFDRALADAVHGLSDEVLALSEDIDRISIDGRVKKDGGVIDAVGAVKFKGSSSWMVQTLVESSKRNKAIPDSFWKLPKDASVASYAIAGNSKRYEPLRKVLSELVDGALEREKIAPKLRDQVGEILRDTWTTDAPVAYAHGELTGEKGPAAGPRDRMRRELGWYVVGVDDKAAKFKAYFDKIVKLYNDAQLRRVVDKRLGVKPGELPKMRSRPARAAGLPAGTLIYELEIPGALFDKSAMPPMMPGARPKPPAPAAPLPIVLLVVPDGERSWFGFSADEKLVTAKLVDVIKGQNTIGSRAELGPLKSTSAISGGYMTLATFVRSLLTTMSELRGGEDLSRVWSAMPHHGDTPMLMWTTVGAGPSAEWTVRVPKAVVEDLGSLGPMLMMRQPVAAPPGGAALMGPVGGPPAPPSGPAPAPKGRPAPKPAPKK